MNTNLKFVLYLIVTVILSSTTFFFIPVAKEASVELPLAIAFASSITQLGAVWYFISSLRAFKRDLKFAYVLLSSGILLFSLVQLLPSLTVFTVFSFVAKLLSNIVAAYLLFMVPYTFGALLMYLGVRRFAKLLDVHYIWNSFLLVFGLSLAMGGLAVLLLQLAPMEGQTLLREIIFGLIVWCGSFGLAAALAALRIRQAIGPVYKKAMTWLAAALGALTFSTFHEFLVKVYFAGSDYVLNQYSLLVFLFTGILFLKAALAFKETGRGFVDLPADASYVDIVVGLAQMVSKPAAIDAALDEVRKITAKLGPQKTLTPADKTALIAIYARIEDYLVTDEPLHELAREDLRNSLPEPFLKDLAREIPGGMKKRLAHIQS